MAAGAFAAIAVFAALPVAFMQKNEHSIHSENATKDELVAVETAVLRQGARGSEVKEVQRRLKQWGYYNGRVDGVFGSGTRAAVIKFQKKNGLTADGVVGSATYKALGMNNSYQVLAGKGQNTAQSAGADSCNGGAGGSVLSHKMHSPEIQHSGF